MISKYLHLTKSVQSGIALGLLMFSAHAQAQFTSGDHFYIPVNATVSIQGMIFKPALNTTWANVGITSSSAPIPGQPTGSISRVYSFENPTQFSGSIGIHYDPSELNGNTESELRIAYSNAQDGFVTTVQGNVDVNNHIVTHTFGLELMEKVTAGNANSTFPVSLTTFTAKKAERQAILSWTTVAEVNSDYFEIQHSVSGKHWETKGKVAALGQSQEIKDYNYADINPSNGDNLYRLKMVDLDGTFSYSQIVHLSFDYESSANVYPNPVVSQLLIKTDDWSKVRDFEVVNVSGKKVLGLGQMKATQTQERALDFSKLPMGVYIVKTTMVNGEVQTQKVVKE